MSKSEKLNKQIDQIGKMILFLMGVVVLIIGYAYENKDTMALIGITVPIIMIVIFTIQNNKKLDELEDE